MGQDGILRPDGIRPAPVFIAFNRSTIVAIQECRLPIGSKMPSCHITPANPLSSRKPHERFTLYPISPFLLSSIR